MELKLGRISGEALAKWFSISRQYFSRNKAKYLQILERYAAFHLESKGNGAAVIIDEIYEPIYCGEKGSRPRQRVKELVQQNWDSSGFDSCSHVAKENYPLLQAEGYTIAESTNYRYTCSARTELWGSPMKKTSGELGSCYYEWGKIGENGQPIPFTPEEQRIKENLIKKHFGKIDDWTLGIMEDLRQNRISAEEAGEALKDLASSGGFLMWKSELEAAIGCRIIKGTRIENEIKFANFDMN